MNPKAQGARLLLSHCSSVCSYHSYDHHLTHNGCKIPAITSKFQPTEKRKRLRKAMGPNSHLLKKVPESCFALYIIYYRTSPSCKGGREKKKKEKSSHFPDLSKARTIMVLEIVLDGM